MVLTKQFFIDEINKYSLLESNSVNHEDIIRLKGIIYGLKIAYSKQSEAPVKNPPKQNSTILPKDVDETFKKIVLFYIKDKGYSLDSANQTAQRIIESRKRIKQ